MKTETYEELIDRIRQKNPPKRITVCVEGWTKDYAWDRKRDNYFDDWGDPLHCAYSLAELAIASIEIYEKTNAEKFKEVFGIELCRWADGKPAACPPHKRECETSATNIGTGNCEKCAEWWDEPYEGDK